MLVQKSASFQVHVTLDLVGCSRKYHTVYQKDDTLPICLTEEIQVHFDEIEEDGEVVIEVYFDLRALMGLNWGITVTDISLWHSQPYCCFSVVRCVV